jgi:Rrf2 family protein
MISLTKKTDYALVALASLAQRAREGAPPVSARKLADEHDLPVALVANILKDLHQAKIVDSTRGPTGGYALAMSPSKITLIDVITATEGPVRLAECDDNVPILGQGCAIACKCPIREPMRRLNDRLREFFDSVTLADLFDSKVDVPLASLESNAALRLRKPKTHTLQPVESAQSDEPGSVDASSPGWLKKVQELGAV